MKNTTKTNWEHVRIQAAIAAMQSMITVGAGYRDPEDVCEEAVQMANLLIEHLMDACDCLEIELEMADRREAKKKGFKK